MRLTDHRIGVKYRAADHTTWPLVTEMQPLESIFAEIATHPQIRVVCQRLSIEPAKLGLRFATPADTMDPAVTEPAFKDLGPVLTS